MQALEHAHCPNKDCKDFGKVNAGNIAVRGKYGKQKDKLLLYCRTCGKRFSSTHGSPLFASHLPKETIHAIIKHISEGNSILGTSRLVGIPRATVRHAVEKIEAFCLKIAHEVEEVLEIEDAHMDKLWSFLRQLRIMRDTGRNNAGTQKGLEEET
jgi:transposase-like protein